MDTQSLVNTKQKLNNQNGDINVGDFVIYSTPYSETMVAQQVAGFEGKYVHFVNYYDFPDHNTYCTMHCRKNHIITGIYNDLIESFESLSCAALSLFKYAIGTKDIKYLAPVFDQYYAPSIMENRYNLDSLMDLGKHLLDTNKLALEFISNCLNNDNLFGLSNSPESIQPALDLFKALRLHN